MKKVFLFVAIILASCNNPETSVYFDDNWAVIIPNQSKDNICDMQANVRVGHSKECCSGCALRNGKLVHVDCQCWGNQCTISLRFTISNSGSLYSATTTDTFGLTDQSFFNMPDRSLYNGKDEKGNDLWLNIPAQLVYRDSISLQFTFTGLFYSNSQYYRND